MKPVTVTVTGGSDLTALGPSQDCRIALPVL